MRTLTLTLSLAVLLAAGNAGAETPALEDIKTAMDTAWKDVTSLSGDVTMNFVMPVGEKPLDLTGNGRVYLLRKDGKDKFRKTVTSRLPEPFSMEMKLDVLYDGKKVYTTTELMGQAQKQEGEPSLRQGALPPGGDALISSMEEEMTLKVLPNEKLDGHDVFVVEGRAKDPAVPFSKVVFYIDQKLGIQRKVDIYQEDGTIGISETISNIQVGEIADTSIFEPGN